MDKIDTVQERQEYIKNKGRIERATWFEKQLKYNEVEYSVMYISSLVYPNSFIKNLPKLGSTFQMVDVRTWKSYEAYMSIEKYQISSLKNLYNEYNDEGYKITEGRKVGIANSPENINEMWIDFDYGKENWLDKDKDKIIIMSMIAVRAFSKKFSINLQSEEVRNEMKEIMCMSHKLLKKLNLIKLVSNELYDKSGAEDPVVNIFRLNSRNLGKKTKGLFQINNNMVYLDASRESEIKKEDFIELLKIIVGEVDYNFYTNTTSDNNIFYILDEICSFCIDVSSNKSKYIFDSEHIFARVKYDNIMRDIIKYYF